jgi:hypothetical protein
MARKEQLAQQQEPGGGGVHWPQQTQWQPQPPVDPSQLQPQPAQAQHPALTPDQQRMMMEAAPGSFLSPEQFFQSPTFPPPGLGKVPASVSGLQPPLPIGSKATYFSGPLMSGSIPQKATAGYPNASFAPVGGAALLTMALAVDYSMGNFTVPVQFPPDSVITGVAEVIAVPFTGTPPKFQLGTTSGAADIVAATAFPATAGPTTFAAAAGQLPLWGSTTPKVPFQASFTVTLNTGSTAGLALVLIQFARVPQKWT